MYMRNLLLSSTGSSTLTADLSLNLKAYELHLNSDLKMANFSLTLKSAVEMTYLRK